MFFIYIEGFIHFACLNLMLCLSTTNNSFQEALYRKQKDSTFQGKVGTEDENLYTKKQDSSFPGKAILLQNPKPKYEPMPRNWLIRSDFTDVTLQNRLYSSDYTKFGFREEALQRWLHKVGSA